MANSPESDSVESNMMESESSVSLNSKTVPDVHPLAFTIEFNDQKVDEARKSKVHERLSAFTLKHRRNPSLPDFGAVRNAKNSPPNEKLLPSPVNSKHVPVIGRGTPKSSGKLASEGQWKSSALKACVKANDLKSPVILRSLEVNGARDSFLKHLKNGRRNSLNDIDNGRNVKSQIEMPSSLEYKSNRNGVSDCDKNTDPENKSDTVSEAGTYTVDKEEESGGNEVDRTQTLGENDDNEEESGNECKKSYRSSWINDWVRDVEEQNRQNPAPKEPPPIPTKSSGSGRSSPGASKIPSPINTLSRKAKVRGVKVGETFPAKLNGTILHRRSSSLSAKVSYFHILNVVHCILKKNSVHILSKN
ncbi:hypothetical protein RUM44_007191 [Polyplax serrata]|uniref:Uncharacterized protein n=1 Tax=Polyplax serrata TaxID=468196 RepID=A0ABR1B058_POLSC